MASLSGKKYYIVILSCQHLFLFYSCLLMGTSLVCTCGSILSGSQADPWLVSHLGLQHVIMALSPPLLAVSVASHTLIIKLKIDDISKKVQMTTAIKKSFINSKLT